ncbi:MAG: hypothetical protein H7Z39_10260 [Burkholderiaceae bacterium]|nr:hypothetical protein [Burkholderiaceae bacterium]
MGTTTRMSRTSRLPLGKGAPFQRMRRGVAPRTVNELQRRIVAASIAPLFDMQHISKQKIAYRFQGLENRLFF